MIKNKSTGRKFAFRAGRKILKAILCQTEFLLQIIRELETVFQICYPNETLAALWQYAEKVLVV
jgi:hypothetical protein